MIEWTKKLMTDVRNKIMDTENPQLIKTTIALYAIGSALFNVALAIEDKGFQVKDLGAAFTIEVLGAVAFLGYMIYSSKKRNDKK